MKSFLLATAIAVATVASAYAEPATYDATMKPGAVAVDKSVKRDVARASHRPNDARDVLDAGTRIGRDKDVQVRFNLSRNAAWRNGGF